ncbi:unnamed protein product [Ectocarpus fasciculatus]
MHPAEIQPLLLPRSFGPTTLFLAPVGLRFRARHAKGRDVKPTVCLLEGVDLCLLLEGANIPGPASRHHKVTALSMGHSLALTCPTVSLQHRRGERWFESWRKSRVHRGSQPGLHRGAGTRPRHVGKR